MFRYNDIKTIDIELTSRCQARCPMCARNYHGGIKNPKITKSDIDLDFFKNIIPVGLLKQLENITSCGNFGDPILNNELIDISRYIKNNSNVRFEIHTNGGVRDAQWWTELAQAMPTNHLVHFGIDGLEDTNHLYRIGVNYNKVIENAKAFIDAGGIANWNFITFKHNQHQLQEARQLAEEIGFAGFFEKQTSRFIGDPWFDVLDKDGNVEYKLEGPDTQKITFIEKSTVENYGMVIDKATISCQAKAKLGVYIDSYGYLWPCPWVAVVPYVYTKPGELVDAFQQESYKTLMDFLPDRENFNLRKNTIEQIVETKFWQTEWDKSFVNNKLPICARICGKWKEDIMSACKDEFLELTRFKNVQV